jgi:hypothetical protein
MIQLGARFSAKKHCCSVHYYFILIYFKQYNIEQGLLKLSTDSLTNKYCYCHPFLAEVNTVTASEASIHCISWLPYFGAIIHGLHGNETRNK